MDDQNYVVVPRVPGEQEGNAALGAVYTSSIGVQLTTLLWSLGPPFCFQSRDFLLRDIRSFLLPV